MSKVVVIGGGAAGMFASIGVDIRSWYMKRMKSLERNFISREKADAILPMPVIWKACSMRSEQMQSFYTVVFMDTRISR